MTLLLPWPDLLAAEGIPFVTHGSSVSKDHIAIHCPWCGSDDPSYHLGISLLQPAWGCWRNAAHRGRRPHRLLFKLLGDAAHRYLPQEAPIVDDLTLPALGSRFALALPFAEPCRDQSLDWSRFLPIPDPHPVRDYALRRGLSTPYLTRYDLRCAPTGFYRWRVLIPLRWAGRVVGWTGRAIGDATPRYLNSPDTDTCAMFRTISGPCRTLVVEGPWDALRLSEALDDAGIATVQVVATLGITLSSIKRAQLAALPALVFGWDTDAWAEATEAALDLCGAMITPPPQRKDWGESTNEEIVQWIQHNGLLS